MGLWDRLLKMVGLETSRERLFREMRDDELALDEYSQEQMEIAQNYPYDLANQYEAARELRQIEWGAELMEAEGIAKAEAKLSEPDNGSVSPNWPSVEDIFEIRRDVDGSGLTAADRDLYYFELEGGEPKNYEFRDMRHGEFSMEFRAADPDNALEMVSNYFEPSTGDRLSDDSGKAFLFDGHAFKNSQEQEREGIDEEERER